MQVERSERGERPAFSRDTPGRPFQPLFERLVLIVYIALLSGNIVFIGHGVARAIPPSRSGSSMIWVPVMGLVLFLLIASAVSYSLRSYFRRRLAKRGEGDPKAVELWQALGFRCGASALCLTFVGACLPLIRRLFL